MRQLYTNVLTLGVAGFLVLAMASSAQKPAPPQAPAQGAKKAQPETQAKKAAPKRAPREVPQLKFEKYNLANGLAARLSEAHRLHMLAGCSWYHVGPAD